MEKQKLLHPCIFEPEGVQCTGPKHCGDCPWNPAVSAARIASALDNEMVRGRDGKWRLVIRKSEPYAETETI